jgi:hypothetical protein
MEGNKIMNDEQKLQEAKKIMEAFQHQTQQLQNPLINNTNMNKFDNQGGDFASHGNGNNIGMGFDNQGNSQPIINNVQPQHYVQDNSTPIQNQIHQPVMPPQVQQVPQIQPPQSHISTTPPPTTSVDPNTCPECKTIHPPLRPGEKCPNASIQVKTETKIDDTTINKHLVELRNIILSQMTSKNIKDGKKFFQYIVMELAKACENYNE